MKLMTQNNWGAAAMGLALGLGWMGVGDVRAASIMGVVNFTGTVTMNAPLATATAFTGFTNVEVDAGTGDYEVPTLVPEGTSVTITAFSFEPFAPPIAPLWSFSVGEVDYQFDLSTLVVSRTTVGENHFLNLSGVGTASITGFDDTLGDFAFTAQQAVGAVGTTVTFSVENVVPSMTIPEPAVVGLVGLSLMGVWVRRRR